jgi:mannose-1-phosphate guanylyltransferase
MSFRPWGVVLAGGDGTRLQSLTRALSGDGRPKQFCVLFGGKSLLGCTRTRLAQAVSADRTLFAVVRHHEGFYRRELSDIDESNIVVQPSNRGTTAAIIHSLLRLRQFDDDAIVGFFPSDHYFADETQFRRAVESAFRVVRRHPPLLVLLGAAAETAEADYGWIEPGPMLDAGDTESLPAFRIERFREKPDAAVAEQLLRRGCLWNTFVLAGRARTFLELLESTMPDMLNTLRAAERQAGRADTLHNALQPSDFSHDVLTRCSGRLVVIRMENAGWCDLGSPERARAVMQRTEPAAVLRASAFATWLGSYRHRLEALCEHTPEESVS